MEQILKTAEEIPEFQKLIKDLNRQMSNLFAYGVSDSQRSYLIAALKKKITSQILVITADSLEAKKITEDLLLFMDPEEVAFFPASSVLPYEIAAKSTEFTAKRLKVMENLLMKKSMVVVAPIQALLTKVLSPEIMKKFTLTIRVGDTASMEKIVSKLSVMGYERCEIIEAQGQFAVRGGILDIYPHT